MKSFYNFLVCLACLVCLLGIHSAVYEPMGERLAQHGYALPKPAPQL